VKNIPTPGILEKASLPGGIVRTWALYAIELENFGSDDDDGELLTRYDEHGEGSPLTWTTRAGAEAAIRDFLATADCRSGAHVIELVVSARFPEPEMP
jgi:hypothetical protein